MKRLILGILTLALLPVLAFATIANAQTFKNGQSINIPGRENINGSAWLSGNTIDVAGTIDGDLYCSGQTVTISGHVSGDVICAGQTIRLTGTVDGSARLAGQTVTISGDVNGSSTLAGQTVALEGDGNVGRDAAFWGQTVNITGQVGRDAVIGSSIATIDGSIGRNVTAWLSNLSIGSSTTIGGFLTYSSPQKASIDTGAQITGKVTYDEKVQETQQQAVGLSLIAVFVWLLMLIVSAVVMALLFPREFHAVTDPAVASFPHMLLTTVVGLVAGIVMPFILIFLAITVLGIPLAIVAFVAWGLILLLSGAVSAYYLGRIVARNQTNAVLTMLIGAAIIALLLIIPLLNVFVWFVAVWYGSGALLLQLKNLAVAPRYDMSKKPARKRA